MLKYHILIAEFLQIEHLHTMRVGIFYTPSNSAHIYLIYSSVQK